MYLCRFGFTRGGGGGRGLTPYGVLGRTYAIQCTGENLHHTVYCGELTPYGVLGRTYAILCTGENFVGSVCAYALMHVYFFVCMTCACTAGWGSRARWRAEKWSDSIFRTYQVCRRVCVCVCVCVYIDVLCV